MTRASGPDYDAVVVGSGPNGLTAAVTLARAGWSVLVIEGAQTVGGGLHSAELFETGVTHDLCAAVHPLGALSPAWSSWPLDQFGLEWIVPDVSFVHVLDASRTRAVYRNWPDTLTGLGRDASAWRRLLGRITRDADSFTADVLQPLRFPSHPLGMARFGPAALAPVDLLTRMFDDDATRALFAAVAAHAMRPTSALASSAPGLVLTAPASSSGWPIARGGSQAIADALADYLRSLGGVVETGRWVQSFDELPSARAILFDTSPHAMCEVLGDRVSARYRREIGRYRYGPGVCKVDFLLSEPIPWADAELARTATFHVAESYDVISAAEAAVDAGRHPDRIWLLGGEPTRCDPSRTVAGRHVAWAYCHVPHGSSRDMTAPIVAELERCAPGFRDTVIASAALTAADLAARNPNLVGGDIGCGATGIGQLFTRPVVSPNPYVAGAAGVYLCSSATPPGGGAHGMCGYNAARTVLARQR